MERTKYLFILLLVIGVMGIIDNDKQVKADEVDLGQIIVSSKRTPVYLSDNSDDVIVIEAEDIEKLPAQNLSEVLGYVPGIDVEPRQRFGRPASLSIHGADSRQVRLMIDGIPFNSQASGQVNPAQFPIENIARIEVIKGGASSVWGSGLGGVVNIITKDTGEALRPEGNFTTSLAEFRTKKESFDLSGKVDKLGYYVFSSYLESGGNTVQDDVLDKDAFGKLSYGLDSLGNIIGSLGYSAADVNTGVFPDGSWQAQPYTTRYGKIGWELDSDNANFAIGFKQSHQQVVTRTYLSVGDQVPDSNIETKERLSQLSINSTLYPREEDLLVVGADFDWDIVKSSYLAKTKSVEAQSPYINYTQKAGPWDFCYGLRYDSTSQFGTELSPSLGTVYHLQSIEDTHVRASVARDFNAPPLLWKYYELNLSGLTTNPDIKAERAYVYELGLESKFIPRVWSSLSVYRADISDAISSAQNDDGDYYMKNFRKFRRQGAELQLEVDINEKLDFFCSGAFNDIENRQTRKTVKGGGKARQSINLGLEYENNSGFELLLKAYYDRWNQAVSAEPNDRKMLFDAKMSQKIKDCILFLNIYNLANSAYWADIYFPVKERYFEGGLTYNW